MLHGLFTGELGHGRAVELGVFRLGDLHASGSEQIVGPVRAEDPLPKLVRVYVLIQSGALPVDILINSSAGSFHVLHHFGLVGLCSVVGDSMSYS